MKQSIQGKAVSIYVGEDDHVDGKPLYAAIVEEARKQGVIGATVTRAMMGYGAHSKIHSTNIVVMAEDLPVIISVADTAAKIDAFLVSVEPMTREGTVVVTPAEITVFRSE